MVQCVCCFLITFHYYKFPFSFQGHVPGSVFSVGAILRLSDYLCHELECCSLHSIPCLMHTRHPPSLSAGGARQTSLTRKVVIFKAESPCPAPHPWERRPPFSPHFPLFPLTPTLTQSLHPHFPSQSFPPLYLPLVSHDIPSLSFTPF